MPIIHVNLIEGRPTEKVTQLIQNITDVTAETLDAPRENVRVLVTEIPNTHWGVAGKAITKAKK